MLAAKYFYAQASDSTVEKYLRKRWPDVATLAEKLRVDLNYRVIDGHNRATASTFTSEENRDKFIFPGEGCNGSIGHVHASANPNMTTGLLTLTFTPGSPMALPRRGPCWSWSSTDGDRSFRLSFTGNDGITFELIHPLTGPVIAFLDGTAIPWPSDETRTIQAKWDYTNGGYPDALRLQVGELQARGLSLASDERYSLHY